MLLKQNDLNVSFLFANGRLAVKTTQASSHSQETGHIHLFKVLILNYIKWRTDMPEKAKEL